jgi:hypothetical protein
MLSVQRSPAIKNEKLARQPRQRAEDNVSWIERHTGLDDVCVLLLGGSSNWDFRLRVAQSHLRDDLTPSHWSHVALLAPRSERAKQRLLEVPLMPRQGLEKMPDTNGVVSSPLVDYLSPQAYPNVAVVVLPLDWSDVRKKVTTFGRSRNSFDVLELHLAWLAFTWGVGRLNNPLYDDVGFPSAALLEYVTSALSYDLTPAFPSRASCPEAIWQAAKYWHQVPRQPVSEVGDAIPGISGAYVLGETLDGRRASPPAARKVTRKKR